MGRQPLITAIVAALVLAGCGAEADEAAKLGRTSVVEDASPVPEHLVGPAQIRDLPAGSVRRAFLEYWSRLQLQRWDAAVLMIDPRLRAVGKAKIASALRRQGGVFLSQRPRLRTERKLGRGVVALKYGARLRDHPISTWSSSWHRTDGRWRILNDSFLDRALILDAQRSVQERIDATAKTPSPQAQRARRRTRRLLVRYMERLRRER